jgi:hypothetical protein
MFIKFFAHAPHDWNIDIICSIELTNQDNRHSNIALTPLTEVIRRRLNIMIMEPHKEKKKSSLL